MGKFLFYFVVIGNILSLNRKEKVLMNFLQFYWCLFPLLIALCKKDDLF